MRTSSPMGGSTASGRLWMPAGHHAPGQPRLASFPGRRGVGCHDGGPECVVTSDEMAGLAAIVTGGGSGIGLATARLFAERGARVGCLDLDPSTVPEPLIGLRADVTDQESTSAAVEGAVERRGGLDVLVNNAGIGAQGTVEANPLDEWRR